ncbi:MAG: TrpB-like pyridoxal phosphate-dependent enzyme [Chloroflexi bacterium]|nr:TrpB-like pyridoxal phosphate-dependent enzyme [Chloroflexota bacterium]
MATIAGNRISLTPREMPARWYNLEADLPFRVPPMISPSGYPITARELEPLFPHQIIEHELNGRSRTFNIPNEVRAAYQHWRPTPMFRAAALERELKTPARLFYKFEGGSPSGSYESNTAIPQAFFTRQTGAAGIVTGGAGGVWISAIGHAAALFGLKSKVYSVRKPGTEQAWGEAFGRVWGVDVQASPSENTRAGRHQLSKHGPDSGSIATALAEAYEEATLNPDVKFAIPTLMGHTLIHQTIVGLEAQRQLASVDEAPDYVIGSIGAGSHFGGLIAPFVPARIQGRNIRFIAVEEASTPSLTRGVYAEESADAAGLMPQVPMYTLGREYAPPGVLAGAMRYHGVAPIVSALYREKYISAVAYGQIESFSAGLMFTRAEGIVLSPRAMYTVKEVIEQALRSKASGTEDTILFTVTPAVSTETTPYDSLLDGVLHDEKPEEASLKKSLRRFIGRN